MVEEKSGQKQGDEPQREKRDAVEHTERVARGNLVFLQSHLLFSGMGPSGITLARLQRGEGMQRGTCIFGRVEVAKVGKRKNAGGLLKPSHVKKRCVRVPSAWTGEEEEFGEERGRSEIDQRENERGWCFHGFTPSRSLNGRVGPGGMGMEREGSFSW